MSNNYLHEGLRVTLPAGNTVTRGQMVTISSNAVVPATAGSGILGVACNNAAAGENVVVQVAGVFAFEFAGGETINVGDRVSAASATSVRAPISGDTTIGIVERVSSGVAWVLITPIYLIPITIE